MKAAGALHITREFNTRRFFAVLTALYLLILVLAPVANAQSTGEIDLELTKDVTPAVVEVGESVTWTIAVSNEGAGDASGVEVGDILPDGLVYRSHGGLGTFDPLAGTWTIGDISAGDTVTLEIVTAVTLVGDIVNEAEVTMADQDDIDSTPGDGMGDDWDDAAISSIPTGSDFIDLELTKSANPETVVVGGETTWTIEVINQGPEAASGVEVGVAVPNGVTYLSHMGPGSFDPGSATWNIGDLDVGESVSLDIVTRIDVVGDLTCVAEVTMADQEDVDSVPGDGQGDDWDDATITSTPTTDDIIDLELTKSADPTNLRVGDQTTWTVDLTNQGPDDATGVEVVVTPPSGVTYISHTGDGSFDAGSGIWTVGSLNAGASVSLAIVTTVDVVGDLTCVAEVTMADQEDVDSTPGDGQGDDWDDATVTVTPTGDDLIDLELTKSANPTSLAVGDETTWTVDLTNQGPDNATGVEVTVTPPSGVTYISHTGDGSFDSATGLWIVGDLAVGARVSLDIVTVVDVEGELTCEAEVTAADQEDIDSTPGDGTGDDWDDATVVATPVGEDLIDLELTKSAAPVNLKIGDETTWTVDLTNQGPNNATGVEVTVAPPAGVTYVSHSGDGSFDAATGLWTIGALAVGDVVSLDIVTTVDVLGDLTCEAEVTAADQEDVDSIPGDGEGDDWDDATVSVFPEGTELIDLELTKIAEPTHVNVGEETTWTISLTNQGPDAATGVAVTVSPPAQVSYVSHIGLGDFDPATGEWSVGDLAVGDTVTLAISTTVDADGTWTCEAEVTAADQDDVDSTPGDGEGDDWDDATVSTDPPPTDGIIDLELTKSANPTLVSVGDTTTWTVELTNQGPDPASGVEVTVSPPSAVTYISHAGDGTFDSATGIWTVGDLAVGATVTLAIETEVDEIGVWICEAEVTAADQEDIDSFPGDGQGDDWDDASVEASSVLAAAIIGDTVWLDEDADGVQDAGEVGYEGATVVLTNLDSGETATQTTNADGLYLFAALEPGRYTAAVQMSSIQEGLGLTTPGSFTITLEDNDAYLTADFGMAEELPATGFDPIPLSLGGLILALLGAVALELTWPEREGRRIASVGKVA
ncbi:MAG: DUF11 domain-containing protein [Acidimicrobiia bacterium]|nr:DUF11 domain-containing protein [Acidimicrobiia bacterium]